MLNLTDEQSYKNYFQTVATSHVDITGYKFGDEEELAVSAKTGLSSIVLWADRHRPVELMDNRSDNYLGNRTATIMIMGVDPELHADQQALYTQCEGIVRDIMSKLLRDYNAGDLACQFSKFKFGEGEVELGSTRYRGCRLDITWLSPIDLSYNNNKWI